MKIRLNVWLAQQSDPALAIRTARKTPGSAVKISRLTEAFAEARELAGIWETTYPPSTRSDASLNGLYLNQGEIDTKALLGHADERTASLYANIRGLEPVRVRIDTDSAGSEQVLNTPRPYWRRA